MRADTLLGAGVALVALGMAAAFLGVLAASLFPVGTWMILLGLLACGAAGVLATWQAVSSADETGA